MIGGDIYHPNFLNNGSTIIDNWSPAIKIRGLILLLMCWINIPDLGSICNSSAYNTYILNPHNFDSIAHKYERLWSKLKYILILFEDNYIDYNILRIIYDYI